MNIENTHDLLDYLNNRGFIHADTEIRVTPLTGGVSNRTVKLDFNGNSWVLKQALEKLRVEGAWFSPPERIYHEAEAIRWFENHLPGTCPKLVFEYRDHYILAMEAVPEPFENLKDILMSSAPKAAYFEKAGELLGQIHQAGLDRQTIPKIFHDTRFFESLRIEPYYQECREQIQQTSSFFDQLIKETRADRFTFTHGDYSPKNLLVKRDQLILLDHEVAHFGDGTFDLGFFMAHLMSKANYKSLYRQQFLTGCKEFFNSYRHASGGISADREQKAIKHTIGCFLARVCGLSQLEYLDGHQRNLQKSIALRLIRDTPVTVYELVTTVRAYL